MRDGGGGGVGGGGDRRRIRLRGGGGIVAVGDSYKLVESDHRSCFSTGCLV